MNGPNRLMMLLMAVLLVSMPASRLAAQSFDCRKARTPDERAVCSDELLSELDELMALFYSRLRRYTREFDNAMGLQGQLLGEAREFLKRRGECGSDRACLEAAYRARIRQLLERWQRAMGDGGAAPAPAPAPSPSSSTTPTSPTPTPSGGEFSCRSLKLELTPRFRNRCHEGPPPDDMIGTWRLGGSLVACALPCDRGAYNTIHLLWLADVRSRKALRPLPLPIMGTGKNRRQVDEVTSPVFDPKTRELRSFMRGRGLGDCGEKWRWRWNGRSFELVEWLSKENCDGRESGWRLLYRR